MEGCIISGQHSILVYTNAKTFPSVQMHARIDVSTSSLRVSSAQRYFNRTPRTAKMSQFVVPLNLVRYRETAGIGTCEVCLH